MNNFQSAKKPSCAPLESASRRDAFSAGVARFWSTIVLLLLAFPGLWAGAHAAQTSAAAEPAVKVIQQLQGTLLEVMKNARTLGYKGRYQKLEPVIRTTYDLPTLARLTLGQHWSSLNPAQQKRFVDTFSRLSIATYASRFDGYTSGEAFKVSGARKLGNGDAVVRSLFIKADGGKVTFDYILMPKQTRWQIINVVVDGVSDLALKRAQYAAVLQKSGFDGLIKELDHRIAVAARGDTSS